MASIKKIIEANLSDKSKLGKWYTDRLEICKKCNLHSSNFKPETIPEKINFAKGLSLNLGREFCTVCLCNTEAKASMPELSCPTQPPKWDAIETVKTSEILDYEIENLSTNKIMVSHEKGEFILQYGTIGYKADTVINILIKPKDNQEFVNLKVSSECGCTTPIISRIKNNINVRISYDSKRVGEFNKLVTLDYSLNNKTNKVRLRIKGKVKPTR
jgi:hypothetical protein